MGMAWTQYGGAMYLQHVRRGRKCYRMFPGGARSKTASLVYRPCGGVEGFFVGVPGGVADQRQ